MRKKIHNTIGIAIICIVIVIIYCVIRFVTGDVVAETTGITGQIYVICLILLLPLSFLLGITSEE